MVKLFRMLPLLCVLALPATNATAQDGKGRERQRPTVETMQRLLDGKMAMAKSALQLNDAQLKLWSPVEDSLRKSQAERAARRAEWIEQRKAGARPQVSLPEKLERASKMMQQRAERTKAYAVALAPLYASFTDAQKAVAGPVFAQLLDQHHRRGHGGGGRGGQRGRMMHKDGSQPKQ